MEEENDGNSFGLSDFLGLAGSAYAAYTQTQTSDNTAAAAQAAAAAANAKLQAEQNQGEQLKKYLLIGGSIILGIVALLVVVKILRR